MKFQRTPARPNSIFLSHIQPQALIGDSSAEAQSPRVSRFWQWKTAAPTFKRLGRRLFKLALGSDEPVVTQKRDRLGKLYYTVYDPVNKERLTCASETEVRAWLEQR
ncbi:MAG: hypothetical protein AAF728_15045, partial [Cyanobacteria bacterium P01_D01_bin.128]